MDKNTRLGLNMVMVVAGMIMLTYATPKLYRMFCAMTGFGGTTQVAKELPKKIYDRKLTIRFDTNVDHTLGWDFKAGMNTTTVKIGENGFAYFTAKNTTDEPEYGMAAYNVVPEKAGIYFNKVKCFCFEKQLIKPGDVVQFPISFFIAPEFAEDAFMDDVDTITLSYTFYKYKDQK